MLQLPISRNWSFQFAMVLAIIFSAPSWAGVDEGYEAWKRGDYSTAVREYQPLAERGSAEAQFLMGLMYANGDGVPQNFEEALHWYRLSADQGYGLAQ